MAPIIPYASRTGTRRNLDALRERGWRLLVSATGALRHEGFPYGIDNGAWTAFQKKQPFDEALFMKALDLLGADADFAVLADIVGGGMASLQFSIGWLDRVLERTRLALLPVQDGMTVEDVRPYLSSRVGVFVGGAPDTDFKERTTPAWAKLCRDVGTWCHVGRVNSQRRIRICQAAGATSFDGTSATRYANSLPELQRAVVQGSFVLDTSIPEGES